ncbi:MULTISPECIES: hypothetical protein [Streptomyces]|uniref:Uncharacterized protein n=1 Tax=Streptomyces albidocamelliae TaxID=2981135 RepID=A0ABY6ENI8_9ACTN|nr:hypothetical protein [Streptomyces sp. HUAS 14-6]UXY35969.1 hypothetical protein N8I86_15200 [Streptomyces sp. HUAS 14-6]
MSRTFRYRFRSPLGGLAADLTAEWASPGTDDGFLLQVDRKVRLAPPSGMHWRDVSWLSFGLAAHASDLMARHTEGLVVRVTALTYPLAHFRSEVAALAMDGWLREEFGLPERGLRVSFDSATGGYAFEWGSYGDPFEDNLLR